MTKPLPLVSLAMVLLAAQAADAQTTLSVGQQSLTFIAEVSGTPTSLPLNVSSSPGSAVVSVTAVEQTAPAITWLSVSTTAGATPLPLSVTVNPSGLSAGTFTGSIVISAFGGGANSVTVPVSLTLSAINVVPASLTFQTSVGNTPAASSVTLESAQTISFSASVATTTGGNWLQISPPFGVIQGGLSAVSAIPNSAVVPSLSAGTYNGSITITPTSGNSTTAVVVAVTLTITPAPAITVSPATVNLEYQLGGTFNNPQQTVVLNTTAAQGVLYTITATSSPNPSGGVWVVPSPLFGSITANGTLITIGYNIAAGLPAGTWTSTVTINTPTGSPTATNIPVNLLVSTLPLLNVPATPVAFTYELGSANPAPQPVTISTTAGTAQSFTAAASTTDGASWVGVPATGSTSSPLVVSVNPAGLAPGSYTGTVTVTGVGTGNGPQQIPVTLKVSEDPALVSNFATLALAYQIGQTPPSQAIALTSSNGVPLNFSAIAAATTCGNWLALSGATGTTPGQLTVSINTAGLTATVCTGTLSITANNAFTGAPALNSPLSIPVTLTVSAAPLLLVSPAAPPVFTALAGGASPASQSFTLSSTDGTVLNFAANSSTSSGGSGWLQVSPATGSTAGNSNSLSIAVQTGSLKAGIYTGTVTVTATAAGVATANSPLTIPVTFLVDTGALVLGQQSLTFQQATGGPAPVNQVVSVTSSGQPLNWAASGFNSGTVNWLTATPSGSTPGSVSVSADGSKLALGTYNGTVSVLSTTPYAGNSPSLIPVTLVVNAGTISASSSTLTFTQVQGGPLPAAQSVTVSGTPGPIPFQATVSGGPWLTVSPASSSTQATLQVGIAANVLPVGTYSGNVTITAAGAFGSPLAIPVTLYVVTPHALSVSPTALTFTALLGSTVPSASQVAITSAGGSAPYTLTVNGGAWLGASPTSGTTSATIGVTVNPTGLANGAYSGTVTVSSPNAVSPVTVTVNLIVGKATPPAVNAMENAASYGIGGVAPGENVVIFGSNIGPPILAGGTVTNGVVDVETGATRVLFDGIPAPLIYASATQTSAMVPYELTGRSSTSVVVEYQGVQSAPVPFIVAASEPGIYTSNSQGFGPGAIVNQNYTINLPSAPAPKGSVVSVYMTGEGYTVGAIDGALATGLLSPVLPVTATVGGLPATVGYAGTSPGIVSGATQVNVQIPLNTPSGPAVPIVITVGTGSTAVSTQVGVTVAIQ